MEEFKDRLQKLRREQGFTSAEDFADHLNMKGTTYRSYESGSREPKTTTLLNFARIFNVSIDYLLGVSDERKPLDPSFSIRTFDEEKLLFYFRQLDEAGQEKYLSLLEWSAELSEKTKKIIVPDQDDDMVFDIFKVLPFFPDRPSAGTGSMMFDNESPFNVQVKDSPIARKADFVLQVEGHSMEPKFHNDDFVLVKKQDVVENGEVGIFLYDGQVFIKQLKDDLLHSFNPAYEDIRIDGEIICFGKVLGKAEV